MENQQKRRQALHKQRVRKAVAVWIQRNGRRNLRERSLRRPIHNEKTERGKIKGDWTLY